MSCGPKYKEITSSLRYLQVRSQEFSRAGEISCNRSILINILRTAQKNNPNRKNLCWFLSKMLLKLHFKWKLNHSCIQPGHIFPKLEHFLQNQGTLKKKGTKRLEETSCPSSCATCMHDFWELLQHIIKKEKSVHYSSL